MRQLVIVGAGGQGRETLDVVNALNVVAPTFHVVGFLDDDPGANTAAVHRLGHEILGPVQLLTEMDTDYVIGIGSPYVRSKFDTLATAAGRLAAVLVHPAATLGADVHIGAGTIICAGARLTTNVRVGRHVHLNTNTTVGHDSSVGDYAALNPGACISGNVTLETMVTLGARSVVIQGLTVGARSTVGAGAAVIEDVAAGCVVVGVPARPLAATA